MEKTSCKTSILALTRIALAVSAVAGALVLTLSVAMALQTPDFGTSYKSGPQFAVTNQVIAYTVVAVNTGDPAQNVVLSDAVPNGATYIPASCTYLRPAGSPQTCGPLAQLWQEDFDTGDRITTTFSVQVTAGSMQWPLENCAYLNWDGNQTEMCFSTIVNPVNVFLPFVARYARAMPDLRVTSLTVEPDNPVAGQPVTITVEVQNVGRAPSAAFWVDLYDNPDPPPAQANEIWNFLCSGDLADCYGIAWLVRDGLSAGQSTVLVSTGGYETEQTHWLSYFVQSGAHSLYAFADSWNWGVWYGAVEELNEGVDNRYGPLSINVAAGANGTTIETGDQDISIVWRPNPH